MEEGLTVVTRVVGLDIPDQNTIVYPFQLSATVDLAPTYYRNRRRLLQLSQMPYGNDTSYYPQDDLQVHAPCLT